MFIMDLTGSMGGFLSEAKRSIRKITEEINDNNPGSKIRLSFIGYRDYDTEEEQRNYEIINFTEDIENFITRIKKFECYGGGDQPEDVAGALNEALKMDWKSNAKYVVLVCDAPCHGSQYHDIYIDTFKEGDPAGYVIEDLMQKFKDMDITFYCMEINKSTNKMFDIMKSVYNDPKKFDVEKIGSNYENSIAFYQKIPLFMHSDSRHLVSVTSIQSTKDTTRQCTAHRQMGAFRYVRRNIHRAVDRVYTSAPKA